MTSRLITVTTPFPDTSRGLSGTMDNCGIVASLACAIHCMAAPFLLLLSPAVGLAWSHPSVHWIMAALVLPLALVVVHRGYKRHKRRSALIAVWLGSAFILAGLLLPEVNRQSNAEPVSYTEQVSEPGGSVGLAADSDDHACTSVCCPVITYDDGTRKSSMHFPPGSIATLIGSAFLVLAHGTNLYGCHCLRNRRKRDAAECCWVS